MVIINTTLLSAFGPDSLSVGSVFVVSTLLRTCTFSYKKNGFSFFTSLDALCLIRLLFVLQPLTNRRESCPGVVYNVTLGTNGEPPESYRSGENVNKNRTIILRLYRLPQSVSSEVVGELPVKVTTHRSLRWLPLSGFVRSSEGLRGTNLLSSYSIVYSKRGNEVIKN